MGFSRVYRTVQDSARKFPTGIAGLWRDGDSSKGFVELLELARPPEDPHDLALLILGASRGSAILLFR